MNEKIKLLAEQAGATVMERSGWTDYGTLGLDVEKFAELIIHECKHAIICAHDGYINPKIVVECLNKHFGVEE